MSDYAGQAESTPPKGGISKKFRVIIIIAGVTAAAVIVLFIAIGLSKSKTSSDDQNEHTDPTIMNISLDANGGLTQLTEEQLDTVWHTPDADVPEDKRKLWEMVQNQWYAKRYSKDHYLDKASCKLIKAVIDNVEKYQIDQPQRDIIKTLLAKCEDKGLVGKASQQKQQPGPYDGIKEFLDAVVSTLNKLLSTNSDEKAALIAQFAKLNKLPDDQLLLKLGTVKLYRAFNSMLNRHVSENKDKKFLDLVDPASVQVLQLAKDNAAELQLTGDQKNDIEAILKLPKIKTPTEIVTQLIANEKLDLNTLAPTPEQKVAVQEELLTKVKEAAEKTKSAVTVPDFLDLLKMQRALWIHFSGTKMADADLQALEAARDGRVAKLDPGALKAVTDNGGKLKTFNQIADVSKADPTLAPILVDIVCSKAMIEQAKSIEDTFADDSYQTLCLVLGSLFLVRGPLKDAGLAAGRTKTAASLDNNKTRQFSCFLNTQGSVQADMGAFLNGILEDRTDMKADFTANVINDDAGIQKQLTVIGHTHTLINWLTELYNARQEKSFQIHQIATIREHLTSWEDEARSFNDLQKILSAASPKPSEAFTKAVLTFDESRVVSHLSQVTSKAEIETCRKIIEIYKNNDVKNESNGLYIRKLAFGTIMAYLDVKEATASDNVLQSHFKEFNVVYANAKHGLIVNFKAEHGKVFLDDLVGNEGLREKVEDFATVLEEKINYTLSLRNNNRQADMIDWYASKANTAELYHQDFHTFVERNTKFITLARRAKLLKSIQTTREAYEKKLHEAARSAFSELKLTEQDDKDYIKSEFWDEDKAKLKFSDSPKLLPLLAIGAGTKAEVALATLYGLHLPYYDPQMIEYIDMKAAPKPDAPAKYAAECKDYAKALLNLHFINSNRNSEGTLSCSSDKKWSCNSLRFSPFKPLEKVVEEEMEEYAAGGERCKEGDTAGEFVLEENRDKSYPLWVNLEKIKTESSKVEPLQKSLVHSVLKETFKTPTTTAS